MTHTRIDTSEPGAPGTTSPAARVLRGVIRLYQGWSARRPPNCRFEPSCSHYAYGAISTYGAARGAWMAARRIARCRPRGGSGYDPVPEHLMTTAPPEVHRVH